MADAGIPYGGGRKVLFMADLPSIDNYSMTLPNGVTWGAIDHMCIVRGANAKYGQGMFKDSQGRLKRTDSSGTSVIREPADTDVVIDISSNYSVSPAEVIIVLK